MAEKSGQSYQLHLEKLKLLEQQLEYKRKLPHLYGWKFYTWAREFFETRKKEAFLCSANQISKSSTQIRKQIHWATAAELWGELWNSTPRQFWYLYPNRDTAHVEVTKKWMPEFLPRGEYKTHSKYGWQAEYFNKRIWALHFNSGVSIYFKTYGQDVHDLQSGSVHYMGLDEETPEEIMSELSMRLAATDGYMSAVFTPTIGQEYWREVIEERGQKERFPGAFKKQVSMFDCLYYEDGTKSPWTNEKIQRAINACKSQQDIDRRIYGRFVVSEGLKYPGFHRSRNLKTGHPLPKGWSYYCGVDPGSGGENHPAAIAIVGVSPDFKQARVFRGWRGDGTQTTAGDVAKKCQEMIKDLDGVFIYYDSACRDFFLIAQDLGLNVQPAEKSHQIGEQIVNVLFKNQMMMIYDYPELDPLCRELSSVKLLEDKKRAKDDFCDALRYAVSRVPWNWTAISSVEIPGPKQKPELSEHEQRRNRALGISEDDGLITIDEELAAWDELQSQDYGTYS